MAIFVSYCQHDCHHGTGIYQLALLHDFQHHGIINVGNMVSHCCQHWHNGILAGIIAGTALTLLTSAWLLTAWHRYWYRHCYQHVAVVDLGIIVNIMASLLVSVSWYHGKYQHCCQKYSIIASIYVMTSASWHCCLHHGVIVCIGITVDIITPLLESPSWQHYCHWPHCWHHG